MKNWAVIGVALMLAGCAQTKYFFKGNEQVSGAPNQRGFMSISGQLQERKLTIEGAISGSVIADSQGPLTPAVECNIGQAGWQNTAAKEDSFHCGFKTTFENVSFPFITTAEFRILWKDDLVEKGEAYRPTQETFSFDLAIDPTGRAMLLSDEQPITSADLRTSFLKVENEERLAEIRKSVREEYERRTGLPYDAMLLRDERLAQLQSFVERLYQRELALGQEKLGYGPWGKHTTLGYPQLSVNWLNSGYTRAELTMDATHWAKYLGAGFVDVFRVILTSNGWKLEDQPNRTIIY